MEIVKYLISNSPMPCCMLLVVPNLHSKPQQTKSKVVGAGSSWSATQVHIITVPSCSEPFILHWPPSHPQKHIVLICAGRAPSPQESVPRNTQPR